MGPATRNINELSHCITTNSFEIFPFYILTEVKKLVKGRADTSRHLTPNPFTEAAWLFLRPFTSQLVQRAESFLLFLPLH